MDIGLFSTMCADSFSMSVLVEKPLIIQAKATDEQCAVLRRSYHAELCMQLLYVITDAHLTN